MLCFKEIYLSNPRMGINKREKKISNWWIGIILYSQAHKQNNYMLWYLLLVSKESAYTRY